MTHDPHGTPSVTANSEATTFQSIEPGAVRPGDLLLVTQIPDEALGQLMQRLDGTVLSHSGIAVHIDEKGERRRDLPANGIASALAENLGVDIGGVRWDRFEEFWPSRDFYTVPMPDDLRKRALDYLDQFEPTRSKEGTFSFIKLINVAAGLRSLELHDTDPALAEELFVASRDVATTWAASPESPSYYCAELVANAYGRTVTRAEMTPPEAGGGLRWEEIREPDWAGTLVRRLERRVDQLDDPDDRAGARLLSLLVAKEWEFLVGSVTAIATSGGKALADVLDDLLDLVTCNRDEPEEEPRVPEPLGPARALPDLADPESAVPHALVTPRMLWTAFGHAGEGRNTLCLVQQP